MASGTGKARCVTCGKEKSAVRCEGCLQAFCYDDLTDHRQELSRQFDEIEVNRDLFRQTLTEQENDPQKHALIKQIHEWEVNSIKIIQQTAEESRQILFEHIINRHFNQMEINLTKLTDQLRQTREENDFNETELNQFKQKLTQLAKELDKPLNISIQQSSVSLINRISVVASCDQSLSSTQINSNTKWIQNGITIAGGYDDGDALNQLNAPCSIYVNNDDQSIYIADYGNHRIVEWKSDAKNGQVVAGGNGKENRLDQLNEPTDVIIDKNNDSLIICDSGNRRVVRWPRRNGTNGQRIISNIDCLCLTMDNNGDLYVSDWTKDEVRRWKMGDKNGTIVAGGNGKGYNLNQLNNPTFVFVDQDHSVYVSDPNNHRVMKWLKGAKEGIVVAGGQNQGNSLAQLSYPRGLIVDQLDNVYVVDSHNYRIMRWTKECREGSIIIGDSEKGKKQNQLNQPRGLSLDRQGNLYVADRYNHRVQKFYIDSN